MRQVDYDAVEVNVFFPRSLVVLTNLDFSPKRAFAEALRASDKAAVESARLEKNVHKARMKFKPVVAKRPLAAINSNSTRLLAHAAGLVP